MSKAITLKEEQIAQRILFLRGTKVLLDYDLASLYGVETRALKQQVRRNLNRFPEDFMFEMDENEIEWLVSHNVIPSKKFLGGAFPMAFTEQGVAMLSSVLRSQTAVQANIAIMRTFVQIRRMLETDQDLARKISQLEKKYDKQFQVVFKALKQLISVKSEPKREIGFKAGRSK